MTPKNLAVIACRLLAIWFFVESIRASAAAVIAGMLEMASSRTQTVWPMLSPPPSPPPMSLPYDRILILAALPLVHFSAAVILYLGASVLAKSMTRDMENEASPQSEMKFISWRTLAFSVLGLFLCAQGVSALSGHVFSMVYVGVDQSHRNLEAPVVVAQMCAAAMQMMTGWILLYKAQATAQLLG